MIAEIIIKHKRERGMRSQFPVLTPYVPSTLNYQPLTFHERVLAVFRGCDAL